MICSGIMYCIVYAIGRVLPKTFFTTVIQIIIGGVIYLGLMLFLKDQIFKYLVNSISGKFIKG